MADSDRSSRSISVSVPDAEPQAEEALKFSASGDAVTAVISDKRSEQDRLRALRRGEGIELSPDAVAELVERRSLGMTAVFRQLGTFKKDLGEAGFFAGFPATLATKLRGEILNPDGSPAERLIVEAMRPEFGSNEGMGSFSWPVPKTVTDRRGRFSLALPGLRAPQSGLRLRLRGQNASLTHAVSRVDAIDGQLGLVVLERTLTPLARSAVGELTDLFPVDSEDADENIEDFQSNQPPLVLGEGDCASEYRTEGGTVSRRRYSVLYRLTDPLVGPANLTRDRVVGGVTFPTTVPGSAFVRAGVSASNVLSALQNGDGDWNFRDRVPIEEPIDVEDFFEDLEARPTNVPKASSLSLGYVAKMRSTAVHAGLSLGRLIYSLPLAPGEEQRIVVSEQRETLSVRERESLSFSEQQEFEESRDTSFDSTFNTALSELIQGSSRFNTNNSSSSKGFSGGVGGGIGGFIGGLFGGIAGGAGWTRGSASSSSSGSSSASQNTSRSFLSETHEAFSSSLERSASVKRRSSRTSVRTATATDRRRASTKFVANRNHCHAMTMQWFEVLRDFSIETRIEGVQLVCFVPMQLIAFRRVPQPEALPPAVNRAFLLHRYATVLRHAATLRKEFGSRRRRRSALRLLEEFAADPFAQPQNNVGTAQDIVKFAARGVFMPNDDISAAIITKDGDRIGPVPLVGAPVDIDDFYEKPAKNRENLLVRLADTRRNTVRTTTYEGSVALPRSVEHADIARVELYRRTGRFAYSFFTGGEEITLPGLLGGITDGILGNDDPGRALRDIERSLNTSLSGGEFDDQIGAPLVTRFSATINDGQADEATVLDDGSVQSLPPRLPYAVAAVNDVLSRRDLRRIEELYQHVVSNTVSYSRSIWESMTDEERAILLERFTIGVPEGGLEDASSEIPLLSAVANRVMGFYGNSMIMPFHIPADLSDRIELTTGDIQDSLLRFHREDFRPPRRSISLPTRGLLGEAVLGRCNSCEMIDHRRFWNWQDSPTPPPVGDAPVLPSDDSSIFGTRAPSDLAANQPTNALTIAGGDIGTGSAIPSSPLAEILKAAPDLARAGTDLTGLEALQKQLQAETQSVQAGRDKAVDSATDLTKDLVGKATELAGKAKDLAAAKALAQDKEEKDKKAADKSKLAEFAKFGDNAGNISALVGAQDEDKRRDFFAGFFSDFPGGADALKDPGNANILSNIFGAFDKVNTEAPDGSNRKLGSAAALDFLNSLGG
ncbi:hypothetical protein M3P21_16295 [Ruegeria sp. 2012CJ41-6]|uniref:Uncharacterized protein n=1 Tax=Ruegeria spongiae TaxID=2942209 RepID=A0ABT0Q5E6_9RHOB|nr:hypothetical protein [Ruegeria spongiae]MCL6285091.1 hypothetical protein [Ruegeria spongiae]